MADTQNGPSLPNPATMPPSSGKKNKKRNRNPQPQSKPQVDGSVSDSVANPTFNSQSKTAPKQRQQSVPMGASNNDHSNMGKSSSQNTRPVSLGTNMHPATPFKEQAYAGPTFQASPAPSSLPVPKFFSKSVPNVVAPKPLEERMAGEQSSDTEHSSPETDAVLPPNRAAQQSPLDMFFKADKAEKEKSRSSSMQSPEMAARRAPPATEPRNSFQQSGKKMFLRELDGDEATISPKNVPPNNNPSKISPPADNDSDSEREAYTKSLKDLLFNNINGTPPQNATPPNAAQRAPSNPRSSESPFNTPSPFHRPTSGPSTPTPPVEQQNNYSLHYGNRNLSPLFQSARQDTPPRPSGLRQQELASDLRPAPGPNFGAPPAGHHSHSQADPNSFSRSYLDQQVRTSQPAPLPPLSNSSGNPSYTSSTGSIPPHHSQHGARADGDAASGASPRTGGASNDIQTMEDDLRRMLKINVLSN